jgi:hypothetical protein
MCAQVKRIKMKRFKCGALNRLKNRLFIIVETLSGNIDRKEKEERVRERCAVVLTIPLL